MIPAKKNRLIHWFFHQYINRLVKKNFHAVNFNQPGIDESKSVLLLANHISWWDGFLMYCLNNKAFKKRFHIMVLEETVRKIFFFRYMGAFSVNKNSRDMLQSLNYAAMLLKDPQNMVVIFPQGKLHSNFTDNVHFEKGVSKILNPVANKTQVIFAATFIENFQYKKPCVNVYLKTCPNNDFDNAAALARAYAQHYGQAKQQQTQIVI